MQTQLLNSPGPPGDARSGNQISKVTLIGTYAPRQCGIATYTQDLRDALIAAQPGLAAPVAVIAGDVCSLHPPEVEHVAAEKEHRAYAALRDELNSSGTNAVSLQHEYGIFGGPDGAWILNTIRGLRAPVVTTCHTVLANPSPGQRQVLSEIGRLSARMVVMTEHGRELLIHVFGIPGSKITVIPHGIPNTSPPEIDRTAARRELGWEGHRVILTTGLLSANKGIHHVIAALPRIVAAHPDVIYVVAGATHPNVVRSEGESFRQGLMDLAAGLGVTGQVRFLNRFAPREELVRMIVAADLFVTPYLNEAQITSGVLAFASGLGKPVISTPYWHARELLDESRGVLVPFASADAIATAAVELFSDPERLQQMSDHARAAGRQTTWQQSGRQYLQLLDRVSAPGLPQARHRPSENAPRQIPVDHLLRLTGPLGVYQHANLEDPDPKQGYCTDDNARALITVQDLLLAGHPDPGLVAVRGRTFEFLRAALDEQNGRFRNFRSAAGNWLDSPGSEDSHGRALWALGHTVRHAPHAAMRNEAVRLFHRALPAAHDFTSPRAWAFTLLGLADLRLADPTNVPVASAQARLAMRLVNLHHLTADEHWCWFEDVLSDDNARLPQALVVTAAQTGDGNLREVAIHSLAWLMHWQMAPERHFRAIGRNRFFQRGDSSPPQWDQQPVEALASLSACLAAHRLVGSRNWLARAERAFAWFHGANDAGLPVGDFETGACRDGVQPGGLNQNCGAESTLAFLQACVEMREFQVQSEGLRRSRASSTSAPVSSARAVV